VPLIGMPSRGRSKPIFAHGLRTKTTSELEGIARANGHDAAVLRAVHAALTGRTRKQAIKLRERLASKLAAGSRSGETPIWARAPLPRQRPWYRTWQFVALMIGFAAIGAFYGVGFHVWQMIHRGAVQLAEQLPLY
jgi:hypothetical protein